MTDTDQVAKYVDRLLGDEKFQQRLARSASSGKAAAKRARRRGSASGALGDAKMRKQALAALTAASEAIEALDHPHKKPKSRWIKRAFILSLLGFGAYVAMNEEARSRFMDAVGLGTDAGQSPV